MNKPYALILSVLFVASTLSGCFKKDALSVAHYVQHPDERNVVLTNCKNPSGQVPSEIDCRNALQASIRSWGSSPLPPVDYGSKQNADSISSK